MRNFAKWRHRVETHERPQAAPISVATRLRVMVLDTDCGTLRPSFPSALNMLHVGEYPIDG